MPDPSSGDLDETLSVEPQRESPLHGYRGALPRGTALTTPAALSITVSRETGARGSAIVERVSVKLGWQVYAQDVLEYICQEGTFQQNVLDSLAPTAREWVEENLQRLQKAEGISNHPLVVDLSRTLLCLATQGEVILLGRGAGFVLPPRTTLNVRLVAPRQDRIAYLSEWMRLTEDEATALVDQRDQSRADFISTHFHRNVNDIHQYDLVLNTSLLGEERCANLIVQAARLKSLDGM